MSERWWIATKPLHQGGEKILGPFESQELALDVRVYVEKVNAPTTYWVDDEDSPLRPDGEPGAGEEGGEQGGRGDVGQAQHEGTTK
jgi:hypothetical protein